MKTKLLLAAVSLTLPAAIASATDYNWITDTIGIWNSSNWTEGAWANGAGNTAKIGSGTVTLDNSLDVTAGRTDIYGTGTLSVTGGTHNLAGSEFNINSIYTQTGGKVTVNQFYTANGGNGGNTGGNVTISGGEFNASYAIFGVNNSTNELTISGTGEMITGWLQFGNNNNTTTNTLNLNTGGTLTTNKIVKSGGSTTVNFNGGTLKVKDAGNTDHLLSGLTQANLLTNGLIVDTNGSTVGKTISQKLEGEGGLTKIGDGTLTLSGANTYTGKTTVNVGILEVTGSLAGNDKSIDVNGTGNVFAVTEAGKITTNKFMLGGDGAGKFLVDGTGTSGSPNIDVGELSVNSGTMQVAGGYVKAAALYTGNNVADETATLQVDGGTVSFGGWKESQIMGVKDGTKNTLTVNGGTVDFVEGKIKVGHGSNTVNTINLNGGELLVKQIAKGNGTANINFNGGTIKLSGTADVGSVLLTGFDSAKVLEGGAIINTNGLDTTIAQDLLHGGSAATDGGLTKNGAGTLTLTGTNTYTGMTTVNEGTLVVTNALAGGVTVAAGTGALFDYQGGELNLALLDFTTDDITGAGSYNLFESSGGFSLGDTVGGHEFGVAWDDGLWEYTLNQTGTTISLSVASIPEPSTYALIGGLAAAGIALAVRRRKNAK